MSDCSEKHFWFRGPDGNRWHTALAVFAAGCAGLFAIGVIAITPCGAASVPAWLDDGISKWNAENTGAQIRFVDIKDSFVWYDVLRTPEIGHERIRQGVYKIAVGHGYEPMDDEERVTTGKPPVPSGESRQKKCWSRSFVLNVNAQGSTKAVGDESPGQKQRMLTSLVCEDSKTWWAGFRIAE